MNRTKIYLADDHAILRDGLKHILSGEGGMVVVGEAGDGKTAYEEIERIKPDVAVLDISMPVLTGLEVARLLRKYNNEIKIIILSRHDNEEYIQEALKNGINGYILKDNAGDDLIRAIHEVLKGNVYLSPRIVTMLTRGIVTNEKNDKNVRDGILSHREKEVLKLVAEGTQSSEIASLLRISVKTVKVHRLNIMNKLDIHNVTDLVKYAIKNGLIEI